MSANEIHKGDVGTIIRITLKDGSTVVDISATTTKQLIFGKPCGAASVTKTASFYTDGTDGILQYTTESGFLDTIGIWTVEAYIEFGGGTQKWHSDISEFNVYKITT